MGKKYLIVMPPAFYSHIRSIGCNYLVMLLWYENTKEDSVP